MKLLIKVIIFEKLWVFFNTLLAGLHLNSGTPAVVFCLSPDSVPKWSLPARPRWAQWAPSPCQRPAHPGPGTPRSVLTSAPGQGREAMWAGFASRWGPPRPAATMRSAAEAGTRYTTLCAQSCQAGAGPRQPRPGGHGGWSIAAPPRARDPPCPRPNTPQLLPPEATGWESKGEDSVLLCEVYYFLLKNGNRQFSPHSRRRPQQLPDYCMAPGPYI